MSDISTGRFFRHEAARFCSPILAIVVAALFLSACRGSVTTEEPDRPAGTDQTPQPAASQLDSCSLVTRTEVEEVFGEPVKEPKQDLAIEGTESTAAISQCTFAAESEAAGKMVTLFLRRSPVDDNTAAAIARVRDSQTTAGVALEDVPEFGDAAFWGRNKLHVFKGGNLYLMVSVVGIRDQQTARQTAQAIAAKALRNLQ